MKESIVVIDNFYEDPYAIREFAAKLTFERVGHIPYPGKISTAPGPKVDSAVAQFQKFLNTPDKKMDPGPFFGCFRSIGSDDKPLHYVHSHNMDWTALIYLNSPEQCSGGIKFYKSQKFGTYYGYQEDLKYLEEKNVMESKAFSGSDEEMQDTSKWEEHGFVGMTFNP